MKFHLFEELDEYVPGGHEGVVNRLLHGKSSGGVGDLSIWHGRLKPGGHSERHAHPESLQVYVGISGEMVVGNDDEEHTLQSLSTAVFPAGSQHFIENRSESDAEVLVVSVPGLR